MDKKLKTISTHVFGREAGSTPHQDRRLGVRARGAIRAGVVIEEEMPTWMARIAEQLEPPIPVADKVDRFAEKYQIKDGRAIVTYEQFQDIILDRGILKRLITRGVTKVLVGDELVFEPAEDNLLGESGLDCLYPRDITKSGAYVALGQHNKMLVVSTSRNRLPFGILTRIRKNPAFNALIESKALTEDVDASRCRLEEDKRKWGDKVDVMISSGRGYVCDGESHDWSNVYKCPKSSCSQLSRTFVAALSKDFRPVSITASHIMVCNTQGAKRICFAEARRYDKSKDMKMRVYQPHEVREWVKGPVYSSSVASPGTLAEIGRAFWSFPEGMAVGYVSYPDTLAVFKKFEPRT